ncbi:MAG: hypothetical protein WBD20_06640 [Pirellulaceae bacterium]
MPVHTVSHSTSRDFQFDFSPSTRLQMIRAPFDPKYFRRFLWVSLVCFASSLWFLYDAKVKYPANGKIAVAYEAMKTEFDKANPDEAVDDLMPLSQTKWLRAWEATAKQNNWPIQPPAKTAKEIAEDIGKQYFMMVLCGLVGVPCLIKWWRARGTWVEGDEEIIRSSRGQELRIANIVKIDKRKWEEKGIAKIQYRTDDDRKRTFVMDDFKYQREPMAKIMAFAEAGLASEEEAAGDRRELSEEQGQAKQPSHPK